MSVTNLIYNNIEFRMWFSWLGIDSHKQQFPSKATQLNYSEAKLYVHLNC